MNKRFIIKGINDDRDFCMCCGRKGLKRVVWIEDTESGEIKHFGTTCAVSPIKGFGIVKEDLRESIHDWEFIERVTNSKVWKLIPKEFKRAIYEPHPIIKDSQVMARIELTQEGIELRDKIRPDILKEVSEEFYKNKELLAKV